MILDRHELDLFPHALGKNIHDRKQVATETRNFSTEKDVVRLEAAKESSEFSSRKGGVARNRFLTPDVDLKLMRGTETLDFKSLVFDGLFFGGNANVGVKH